jgi:RHS repeat-associated protein
MTTDPLFMKIGADYYYYHNDHIGTPQKLTSASGAVVWSSKYSSFGEASVDVGTVTNNLRFAGQYYDAETGLHYNLNRYYRPENGRYLSVDPSHSQQTKDSFIPFLLFKYVHSPLKLNNFAYVESNPTKQIDPLGLSSKCPCNTINEVACRLDCSAKGMAFKKCRQSDSGSNYTVYCHCSSFNPEKREPWIGPGDPPPPPDACVSAGMLCAKGKWYVKPWACLLFGACITFGGT